MMHDLKILFIILVLLCTTGNLCQAQNSDKTNTDAAVDTNIVEILMKEHNKSKLEYKIVETKESINRSRINNNQAELGRLLLLLGSLYMEIGEYETSLNTLDELNKTTHDDTLRLKIHYNKASIYGRTMKYDAAIEELSLLRKLNETLNNKTIEAYALNQIGVIYAMQKSLDVAQKYVEQSLALSIENNDYECMANAYSNLATFCNDADSSIGQYLGYSHKALHYYQLTGNNRYILSLYNDMVMRFWEHEMQDSVDVYLNRMFELMPRVDFPEEVARIGVNLFLMGKIENEDIILKMFERLEEDGYLENNIEILISSHYFNYKLASKDGDFEKALGFYQKYKSATDTFYMRLNTDKINIIERNFALENAQEVMKRKGQQRVMAGIIILLAFILIIILLTRIVINHKSKIKKATAQQATLQTKLDGKNKELVAYLMQLIKIKENNNKMIGYLRANSKNFKKENSEVISSMIADLKNNANDDFWTEFNLRFKDVNSEFYQKLSDHYPGLTVNERRLCAFLYLDMSTKEVANITGQSIDSINLARTRLRRKLGLTSQKSPINSFLQNL